jgi:integrase
MAVYRRGKTWWYSFEFQGRRIQESTKCRNMKAAKDAEAVRRAQLIERRAGITRTKMAPKFDDFLPVFLKWSEHQHRPKTHDLHSDNCSALKRYFSGKWLDEITLGMVDDFKPARLLEKRWGEDGERTVGNATVNRALSTLRLIFNYAERCGYPVRNPMRGIQFLDEGGGRMRIISLEEEISYMTTSSQPLKDIARAMLDTGMRPEEVFRTEVVNLDFAQRTIFNPFGKTPAARRKLTMTEEVWSVMKDRAVAARGRYAFPSPENPDMPIGSVRKAHDAAVRRARIKPRFRLYDLRHTYASRAAMAGVDLPTLAALLGHTSIQMTMRYVHPAEEHKREAVGKLENFKIAEAMRLAEKSQPVSTISTTLRMMN